MRLLDYIFYRSTRFYKRWGESYPEISGQSIVVVFLGFLTLSVINLFLYGLDKQTENYKAIIIITAVILWGICLIVFSSRRYVRLHARWKDERYQQIKGWLIFGLVFISIVTYFITLSYTP
jgi:steroid 5-alpha reductase family enzyme